MISSRLSRALLVAFILIAALALRIAYIEITPYRAINDAGTYNRLASMVARTGDYDTGSGPGTGAGGSRGPTAYFPPGFPYFLAAVDLLDGHRSGHKAAVPGERMAMALLGTASVGLVGLVAVEALGGLIAVVAMILAAVYPVLVELSGTLVAENLVVVLILAAVWAGLRARRSERPYRWIAAAGALTGLATVTHLATALLLIPLAFAGVAAARAAAPDRSRRSVAAAAIAMLIGCTAAAIVPWTIRNAVELHSFVPISTETGITLVGTYNREAAAYAPVPDKWIFYIRLPEDQTLFHHAGHYSEVALSNRLLSQTLSYIAAHPLSPLEVGWHNLQRMFELEGAAAWHDSALAIGLSISTAHTGVIAFWILCCLAGADAMTAAVRRGPRWIWLVGILMALSVVLVNVETPRFREPVEPFLVLLAACAVAGALRRLAALRGGRPWPQPRWTDPARR